MTSTRRFLLSTAPLLAVAGCSSLAATTTATATGTGTANALTITTVPQATTFWGTVKGVVDVAAAAVSLANPALFATLSAALSVGDSLLEGLPGLASDATSLASGITALVQHGAALLTQAGANVTVVSNGNAN